MSAGMIRRRLAAGTTALALGLGLVAVGASTASAVDTIPANTPGFLGTVYLANGETGADYAPGTTLTWGQSVIGLPAPGDLVNPLPEPPASLGWTGVSNFISPRGQEMDKTKWNAFTDTALTPGGQYLQNFTPFNLTSPGQGSPSGTGATAGVSGDYSLGMAYTKDAGVNVVGVYFVHITVTGNANPSLATYTWQPVQQAAPQLPATTTAITSFPSTVQENTAFDLTATVSQATATGSVEFFNGATSLGTATVVGGAATLNVAAGVPAGSASVTAVYSGDTAFAGSTSPAVTIAVTGQPQDTTTAVTATSADNVALHPVTLSAHVTAANATVPTGSITFTGSVDGGSVVTLATNVAVNGSGDASVTVSGLTAGTWTINAAFIGTGVYLASASTTAASLVLVAGFPASAPAAADAVVTIPEGTLTLTTPYTQANPLDLGTAVLDGATSTYSASAAFGSTSDVAQAIKIVDTRAGAPGFTAQVAATDFQAGPQSFTAAHAGLENLAAHQVTGNTLLASDVSLTNIGANSPGLSSSARTFATYPAGHSTGTAWISGTLNLSQVESSVLPGQYRATLTFTAF